MLPQVGKEFLVRIRFSWRQVFRGRYLLLANTAAAGGMLALGDILQQSWEIHKEPRQVRDWKRTGQLWTEYLGIWKGSVFLVGVSFMASNLVLAALSLVCGCMLVVGLSLGPPLHYWYGWLERVYTGNALSTVSKKVLVDQLFASPVAGIWYFLGMNWMEGHTLSEGWEELKDKFWEFYKADWCVWPAVQMINFYFLPPKYRVFYISTVSLGWDVYLSYLKNRNDRHPTAMVSDSSAADVQQKALLPPKLLEEKA